MVNLQQNSDARINVTFTRVRTRNCQIARIKSKTTEAKLCQSLRANTPHCDSAKHKGEGEYTIGTRPLFLWPFTRDSKKKKVLTSPHCSTTSECCSATRLILNQRFSTPQRILMVSSASSPRFIPPFGTRATSVPTNLRS